MIYQLNLKAKKLLTFLKLFKINNTLNLSIKKDRLRVRNIDNKDFSGVLEGELRINSSYELDLSINSELLLDKLDLFLDQEVLLQIDDTMSIVTISSLTKSIKYSIECALSPKVSQNLNIVLVPPEEPALISFEMASYSFLECMKAITKVDNLVVFKFLKQDSNNFKTILNARRTKNLSEDFLNEGELLNKRYLSENIAYYTQIYYNSTVFNNFLKGMPQFLSASFYQNFLVLENVKKVEEHDQEVDSTLSLKLYVPLRQEETY